jgi:hypothetical protein
MEMGQRSQSRVLQTTTQYWSAQTIQSSQNHQESFRMTHQCRNKLNGCRSV